MAPPLSGPDTSAKLDKSLIVASPAFCPLSPGRPGRGRLNATSQFPHCVRTHLERRELLAGKTVVREYSDPPRPQFLFDCGNRILSKCGRSPMLGYAVLLRLNNVNAANQMLLCNTIFDPN